jgi:hypothetical protein
LGPRVTEAERLALQSKIDQQNAAIAGANKKEIDKQLSVADQQLKKLDSIDKQITAALTFK